MHALIDIGVQTLEVMFSFGMLVAGLAVVMGLVDDVKTFIKY